MYLLIGFCFIGLITGIVSMVKKARGSVFFFFLWVGSIAVIALREYTQLFVLISVLGVLTTLDMLVWLIVINKDTKEAK